MQGHGFNDILGTLSWDLSRGGLRFVTFVWVRAGGVFLRDLSVGVFVGKSSLPICRLGPSVMDPSLGFSFETFVLTFFVQSITFRTVFLGCLLGSGVGEVNGVLG